jgi:ParB family transcriptional regulator, chromosome partitioning protein
MTPAERARCYRKLAKKRRAARSVEWYTPPGIIALVVEVMGAIDTDPASCAIANETVGAKVFHTLDADGFAQQWAGRVFLNAPYSKISSFVAKLVAETAAGRVTEFILLTANSSDSAWFQKAAAVSSAICFPARRIKFISPHSLAPASPPTGQAVFYRGPHAAKFAEVFAPLGRIVASGES